MIKAVLFDLDGTLLDTNELIYMSFCHTFKSMLNKELTREEITSTYGKPLEATFSAYTNDEKEVEELVKEYRRYNLEIHDDMCKPFDDVEELLLELKKRNIKTAIVTSKRKQLAERGLELGKLKELLDVIVTPEDTTKHKPEAEPAIKACELLGVKPEEALMVGDSSYDLLCGKSAGCKTCGVEYTVVDVKQLLDVNPTYMVKSPLEILDLLD